MMVALHWVLAALSLPVGVAAAWTGNWLLAVAMACVVASQLIAVRQSRLSRAPTGPERQHGPSAADSERPEPR